MRLITEADTAPVAELEARLQAFYDGCPNYDAFAAPSQHPEVWHIMLQLIREIQTHRGACRVLEVGAGRSGFGAWLRAAAVTGVTLSSHDITARNQDFLATFGPVFIGSITSITGNYDLIFHTYVYEHILRPRESLWHLWGLLAEGGHLVIQCPRYDRPFYLPPACDHLTWPRRLALAVQLLGRDLRTAFTGNPDFVLFSDPSALHRPFRRDRDVVHRVKRADLIRLLGARAQITDFKLAAAGWKDCLVKHWLTLRVILRKTPPSV